jgi:hypothetical protein
MADDSYRKALRDAIAEYEELSRKKAEIDERIARLAQTIGNLARLCNLVPTVAPGLTDACRMVLKAAGQPLTAGEVRVQLEALGWDASRYANPLSSIHVVLRRLCRAGEAGFLPRRMDKPAYVWKRKTKIVALAGPVDPAKLDF